MNRLGKRLAYWIMAMTLLLHPGAATGAENVRIPFIRYQGNEKYVPTGAQWGWTTRFQDGASEERGKVAETGFLRASLSSPKGAGPFAFVILMHGCGGLDAVATKWATMWTRALAAWGIGTLTLDSFTTRGVKATCGPPDAHWSRRRVDDAYSALEFLAARRDVKADKVYMMGPFERWSGSTECPAG